MKRIIGLLLVGMLLCLVSVVSVYAAPIKLSYANFPPAPTFPCVQMERWKAEVEKRTGGKVVIDTYPGGTLLDAKNMMDGVIAGQADIGCLCMAYQPGRFIITNALGLPLGIADARIGSLILWELHQKYPSDEAFKPVKVLTMFVSAPSNIMSKKPIRTLDDVKGQNLRASGSAGDVLKAWGANMIGMPMSDTPEALQKGVIQGLFSSLEVLKDFKYAESCRYVTMVDTSMYPFAVVMNLDSWNALPDDVKKAMDDLRAEQAEWTGKYMDDHVKESVDWSKETYQLEVIQLPPEERTKWDVLLAPITAQWIADAKAKGFPAEQIVEDIKALIKKYTM